MIKPDIKPLIGLKLNKFYPFSEEDTNIVDNLTLDELNLCKKAAKELFPDIYLLHPRDIKLRKGVKFEFAKLMPGGESITLQVHDIDNYDNLNTTVRHIWDLLDNRLKVTNKR